MFSPTQEQLRNFFFDTFEKNKLNIPLTSLEKQVINIIIVHPEYHHILSNRQKYLHYQWHNISGEINPFLHLSMHLTIIEQLSINQPEHIREIFNQFIVKYKSEHDAIHELMDCIAEMVTKGQYNHDNYDINIFYNCVNHKLGL